jgi:uncharacterized protein with PQ loop repeat
LLKIVLVLLGRFGSDGAKVWTTLFIVTIFAIVVVYRRKLDIDSLMKLDIDCLMKLVITLSVYLGTAIFANQDSKTDVKRLHLTIITLNLIYLAVWLILFLRSAPHDFKLVFTSHHLYIRN